MNFKILKVFTIIAINTLYFYNFIRYLQKIQLLATAYNKECLKNRDFVEIDFSESPPHSLLDI